MTDTTIRHYGQRPPEAFPQIALALLERAQLDGIPQFNGRPIITMTDSLILALIAQLLDSGVTDTAREDEPGGWLYETAGTANGEKVWIQQNGDGWTIMLASDY